VAGAGVGYSAGAISTNVLVSAPAAAGEARSPVRTLAQPCVSWPCASGVNQAPSLMETQPGAMRSVTRAGSTVAPRSLNTRTFWPSTTARGPGARGGSRMHPDVVPVGARQDRLVVMDRVRARPRLRGDQPQRMAPFLGGGDPGRGGRDRAEPVGGGLGRDGHRIDLDLPRRRRKRMVLGVADLLGERDGVVWGGQAGEAPRRDSVHGP